MKRIATAVLAAGLLAAPMLAFPSLAEAQVSIGISVTIPPPPLPVYEQPIVPGPGYIWTPGYWAWDGSEYYWVPGTWVMPPEVGLLWTPGWWGWSDGYYRWHPGYWAPQVGFYGGIDYGYGYFGSGYVGGYWRDRQFFYNRAVNNVSVNIRNVYVNRTVVRNVRPRGTSYNGGRGGLRAQPTSAQRAAARVHHRSATPMQVRQRDLARQNPAQRVKGNRAHPAVFATQRPGNFQGPHVVRSQATGSARPTATSTRQRATMQAPRERSHGTPQPQSSGATARPRPTVQAPRDRTRAAPQPQPTGAMAQPRPAVQAPRGRTQPQMRPQPATRHAPPRGSARPSYPPPPSSGAIQPPRGQGNQATRNAPRGGAAASSGKQRGKARQDKGKPRDGQHR